MFMTKKIIRDCRTSGPRLISAEEIVEYNCEISHLEIALNMLPGLSDAYAGSMHSSYVDHDLLADLYTQKTKMLSLEVIVLGKHLTLTIRIDGQFVSSTGW